VYFEVNQDLKTLIRSHNYGFIECHTLSSDLSKIKNNRDHHMQKTHIYARFHKNWSICLTCSVLTRST